jgi:hypothetical protein
MPGISPDQARAQLRRHHFAHIHPSITERVAEAVERELTTLDNPGFASPAGWRLMGAKQMLGNVNVKAVANPPYMVPPKS